MRFYALIIVSLVSIFSFLIFSFLSNKYSIVQITNTIIATNQSKIVIEWTQMIQKYLNLPLDNHYGSHAIVLLAALYVTKSGPVLELGMGSTSSPLLHQLALDQNRFILSADSDFRWINYYSVFSANSTLHELKYIEVKTEMGIEWATAGIEDYKPWKIVFIDHRPGPRRQFDLMSYCSRSDLVILHDTERISLYKYDQGLRYYPYQYRFTKLQTYTDVLSAKHEELVKNIRYLLEITPHYFFPNRTLN